MHEFLSSLDCNSVKDPQSTKMSCSRTLIFCLVVNCLLWSAFGVNQLSLTIVERVELEMFKAEAPCDLVVAQDAWPYLAFDDRVGFTLSMDHDLEGRL